jgi:hypothetical protein
MGGKLRTLLSCDIIDNSGCATPKRAKDNSNGLTPIRVTEAEIKPSFCQALARLLRDNLRDYQIGVLEQGKIARLPRVGGVTKPRHIGAFAFRANHPKGENALVATACIEAMGRPLKYLIRQRLTMNSEKGKGWESYWLALAFQATLQGWIFYLR